MFCFQILPSLTSCAYDAFIDHVPSMAIQASWMRLIYKVDSQSQCVLEYCFFTFGPFMVNSSISHHVLGLTLWALYGELGPSTSHLGLGLGLLAGPSARAH